MQDAYTLLLVSLDILPFIKFVEFDINDYLIEHSKPLDQWRSSNIKVWSPYTKQNFILQI